MAGSPGAELLLQSINGIRYKTWFAGIGVGIDYYERKSYPFFFDIRKDFSNKPTTFFAYADAGFHIPYKKTEKESEWYSASYSNGVYTDIGGGIKIGFRNAKAGRLLVSSGYSYKYAERVRAYTSVCPGGCPANFYTYTSYLHRFSMKLGWQF